MSIPGGIPSLDPADADTSAHQTMDVDLRTVAADQDRETPAVVSIQRLRPGSQTVVAAFQEAAVTGPFTVRVVLSETPFEPANFAGKINVTNGIKSGFVIGTPFVRHGGSYSVDHDGNDPTDDGPDQSQGRRSGRIRLRGVTTMTVLNCGFRRDCYQLA